MRIRVLLAPLALALGLPAPSHEDATCDTDATRLDSQGNPIPDDNGSSNHGSDGPPMPGPGGFVVGDGEGGQILGVRLPAGLAPTSIEELHEDGGGVNVTGRVKTYTLPAGDNTGRNVTVTVTENSGGGVEGFDVKFTAGE